MKRCHWAFCLLRRRAPFPHSLAFPFPFRCALGTPFPLPLPLPFPFPFPIPFALDSCGSCTGPGVGVRVDRWQLWLFLAGRKRFIQWTPQKQRPESCMHAGGWCLVHSARPCQDTKTSSASEFTCQRRPSAQQHQKDCGPTVFQGHRQSHRGNTTLWCPRRTLKYPMPPSAETGGPQ